jgi:hypothetical protein
VTFPAPDLPTMQDDFSGLITDWGVSCVILRKAQTRNSAGQISSSFSTVGTETIWIQPYRRRGGAGGAIGNAGLLDDSAFEYFERFSGYAIQAGDQLAAAGESYVYDVLSTQTLAQHHHGYLKQVKRS